MGNARAIGGKLLASLGRLVGVRATLLQLAGMASIAGGLWLIYPPAALITVGVGLVLLGQGERTE